MQERVKEQERERGLTRWVEEQELGLKVQAQELCVTNMEETEEREEEVVVQLDSNEQVQVQVQVLRQLHDEGEE